MKKMLVKAVALSLVMGGVGFVANNALAYDPIVDMQIKAEAEARVAGDKLLNKKIEANADNIATNKANIQTNANDISDNKVAIQKEAAARRGDIANVDFKAKLEKQERENADKKLEQKIDKNANDI